jgi:N6-adenosine-specific RNA methylase IME4
VDEIKALPVLQLVARNCALLLWTTGPMLPDALGVIAAWGFTYRTFGFTWAKLNPALPPREIRGSAHFRPNKLTFQDSVATSAGLQPFDPAAA